MRKSIRSVLSAFLALCLIFGMPLTALADTSSSNCGNRDDATVLVDEAIKYCELADNIVDIIADVIDEYKTVINWVGGIEKVRDTAIDKIKGQLPAAKDTIEELGFDLEKDEDKLANEAYEVACIYYNEQKDGGTAESARKLAVLEMIRFTLVEVQGYSNEKAVETANFYYEVNDVVKASGKDAAVTHVMNKLAGPHVYGEPTWTWAADNTATALFKCTNPKCSYTQEVKAAVTTKTTDATCEAGSSTAYTATATLDTKTATDTKTVTGNPLGHTYGEATWSWAADYSKATVSATCTRSGCGKTTTVDAVIKTETKGATCTEGGNITYTATAKLGDKDLTDTKNVPVPAGHRPAKVEAVAVTCEADGVKEHYKCVCGKLFADAEAKTEVTAESLVIAKTGHKPEKVAAVAATCETDGTKEHYKCACGKLFADAEGKTEVTAESLVIKGTHTPVKVAAVAATCEKEGTKEHYKCACGKLFSDAEGKTAVTAESLVVPVTDHNYLDGVCSVCGAAEQTVGDIYRIYGSNRYQTAFETADILKDVLDLDLFEAVVVASGTDFADALSGSYLATVKNAPILLTNARNEAAVQAYIAENLESNGTVYILGGENAVAKSFEQGLSKDYTVKRLAGSGRYATNLEILKEAGVAGKEILVCTGTDYADSLSASALGQPILLVKSKLFDYQIEFLSQLKDATFRIVGGESVVSNELSEALAQYGKVNRTGGSNRYQTSVLLANQYHSQSDTAVLAYARNFPDGLCGGPLAYALNAPMLLTQDGKELVAVAYTTYAGVSGGYVLGGEGLISDETAWEILNPGIDYVDPDSAETGDTVTDDTTSGSTTLEDLLASDALKDAIGDATLEDVLGDATLEDILGDANLEDIIGSLTK